jgi:hypothetical protein
MPFALAAVAIAIEGFDMVRRKRIIRRTTMPDLLPTGTSAVTNTTPFVIGIVMVTVEHTTITIAIPPCFLLVTHLDPSESTMGLIGIIMMAGLLCLPMPQW